MVAFCQFNFGALSLFSLSLSLSLSLTIGHLEFSWSTLALDQERKRRQEKGRRKQGSARLRIYNKILCRYQFSCVISLLDLAFMVFHGVLCCHVIQKWVLDKPLSLKDFMQEVKGAKWHKYFVNQRKIKIAGYSQK